MEARYHRLAGITGDLKITDPTKVYIQALETDDPMHFAWRIYYPPNYKQMLQNGNGFGGTRWSSGSSEFIARVRFRPNESGYMEVYTRFAGGSSRGGFEIGSSLNCSSIIGTRFTSNSWLATGLTELEPDESAVLLKLSLPEEIEAQARKTLSPSMQKSFIPVVYELGLGPKTAKP